MKKLFYLLLCFLMYSPAKAQLIDEAAKQRAKQLVSQMTLREKIDYLGGETSFSLRAIPRLNIPRILLADGPQGIRNHATHSTLYPSGILTAATWDRSLARKVGEGLGLDSRARGVGILLGPGVNIYRSPLCGRNFEYFGEDPFLTSEIACEYIQGVQSKGVMATIKHFAANNQEWNRHHASSNVDERTLFEIYFPAFYKAIQKAHVGAVMNSYNLINGVHATENQWLNINVLRDTWGFDGLLMSDWTSVYSIVNTANHGLDLEMPKGRFLNYDNLMPAIKKGLVTESTINLKVQHILQSLIAFGLLDRDQKDSSIPLNNPATHQMALDIARGGIVMLKNDNLLPLHGTTAIVGENANQITTGGGSGNVNPFTGTTLIDGMKATGRKIIQLTDEIIFDDISDKLYVDEAMTLKGYQAQYFKNQKLEGQPDSVGIEQTINHKWYSESIGSDFPADHFSARWICYYQPETDGILRVSLGGDDGYRIYVNDSLLTGDWGNHSFSSREKTFKVKKGIKYCFRLEYFDNISDAFINCNIRLLNEKRLMAGLNKANNVIYSTGFNSNIEGEGFDRCFALTDFQEDMIQRLSRANRNLVVVLNAGGGVDMSRWISSAKAVLMAWYPGQEGGTALAEILTGKISPSGKLPISIERRWEDNPCHNSYYANDKNHESTSVIYSEGIFTGYRGYDESGVKPLFPFGFGLSYSSFTYSNLSLKQVSNGVEVSFDIKNTGKYDAAEVAEVYVSDVESSVVRPQKELKGFEKVMLKKGEQKHICILLTDDAFKFYDINTHHFVLEPGIFKIMVGGSSDNLPLNGSIRL
jgi:beta-glucosidase